MNLYRTAALSLLAVDVSLALAQVPEPPGVASSSPVVVWERCENAWQVMGQMKYPRSAFRAGIHRGEVIVEFMVGADGKASEARVVRASHQIFADVALDTAGKLRCSSVGPGVRLVVPFRFQVK